MLGAFLWRRLSLKQHWHSDSALIALPATASKPRQAAAGFQRDQNDSTWTVLVLSCSDAAKERKKQKVKTNTAAFVAAEKPGVAAAKQTQAELQLTLGCLQHDRSCRREKDLDLDRPWFEGTNGVKQIELT